MDEIEKSAASLNRDIDANVTDPGFVAGWKTWYTDWRRNFYDKYRSGASSYPAQLGALVGSDELFAAVENQGKMLRGWFESYTRQRRPDGTAVPFPTGLPPVQTDIDPNTNAGWTLPWWFWVAAGAAGVFFVYRFYQKYQEVQAKSKVLEERFLPAFFEKYGLPGKEAVEVAQAGTSRASRPGKPGLSAPPPRKRVDREDEGDKGERDRSRTDRWSSGSTWGYEEDRDPHPNFTYDRSRDPLAGRFR
jgi:hypothetical protein